MRRIKYESNNNNFYYMAGVCIARYYGIVPLEFRKEMVSRFKEWMDAKYGSDVLPRSKATIDAIVQQFLYEFKKGERNGKQRH